jgi:hypothetical protein
MFYCQQNERDQLRDSTFTIRGARHRIPAWIAAALLGLAGALGACSDDTCEPEGELVASSPQIGVIALDEEAVSWTALPAPGEPRVGEVWRKAKDGGEPERLYQGVEEAFFPFPRLSVDATHVYWLEPCSRPGVTPTCAEVRRVPKAGGAPQTLVRDRVYSFAVDGDRVYYSTSNEQQREGNPSAPGADGAVWSMPKDGSSQPVALASNLAKLRQVAVYGDHVYFVADRGTQPGTGLEAWISRVPKMGGDVETAALASGYPDTFVLSDQGMVFFEDRTLVKVPEGDTRRVFVSSPSENSVQGLAAVGNTAYFGDSGRIESGGFDGDDTKYICGAIRSMPLSGGEGKIFSQEQIRPHSLVIDGAMLYWVSQEPDFKSAAIRRSKL